MRVSSFARYNHLHIGLLITANNNVHCSQVAAVSQAYSPARTVKDILHSYCHAVRTFEALSHLLTLASVSESVDVECGGGLWHTLAISCKQLMGKSRTADERNYGGWCRSDFFKRSHLIVHTAVKLVAWHPPFMGIYAMAKRKHMQKVLR